VRQRQVPNAIALLPGLLVTNSPKPFHTIVPASCGKRVSFYQPSRLRLDWDVAQMKNLTLAVLLLTTTDPRMALRGQTQESGTEDEPWSDALRGAIKLGRRGEYRQAVQGFEELLSSPLLSANKELRGYVLYEIADCEIELGEYVQAETRSREALRNLSSGDQKRPGMFAMAESLLAVALRAQGNYAEAKAFAEDALVVGRKTMDQFHPRFGSLLTNLAQVFQQTGDLRRAGGLCLQAATIFEKAGKANRIDSGSAYQNLAVIYVLEGKGRQALETVNRALAVWTQVLAPNHPFLVYALGTKIVAYKKLKMFQEAEDMIPQTLELCVSRFGPDHPERVILLNNTASVYLADKKYGKAEPLLREAVELCRRKFAPGHPLLSSVLLNYSNVLRKLNRNEDASLARAQSEVVSASRNN
jgi:tetratricopeptide (TPR) repeat protein